MRFINQLKGKGDELAADCVSNKLGRSNSLKTSGNDRLTPRHARRQLEAPVVFFGSSDVDEMAW